MGTTKQKEKRSLMFGTWSRDRIFSIYFSGPAKDLMQFLKDFEENIGSPYFGWNGEFWDEN